MLLCSMSWNSTHFNGFAKLSSNTITAYAYYCGPEWWCQSLPSIIHLLWALCPTGFGNLPYKLIRTVKGDKANGITSLLNSVIN